ncbi:MAG: hypothetical protein EOP64_05510 [Sphingomonas sp.]|nr:MAG: hypothetical protein EOP64_05510 [Sphingomonas sp.]
MTSSVKPAFIPVTAALTRPEALFNHTDVALPYRSARAIRDREVTAFIEAADAENDLLDALQDPHIRVRFLAAFPGWLQSSKRNRLVALETLPYVSFTCGTIQAFDAFYLEHRHRRFRCFRGDFMYHLATWRRGFAFAYIEDAPIAPDDAVVISLPFSDSGTKHARMDETLADCDRLNIPVLVDCAYMNIAGNIDFDFSHPCISVVAFSLSKTFFGFDKLRIGVRFSRSFVDDFIDTYNTVEMSNQYSCHIGLKAISHFPVDHTFDKHREGQLALCNDLKVAPSDCVIFGIGGEQWQAYNRGTATNRLCLSSLLELADEKTR